MLSQNHPRALVSGSVEVSCVALQLVGRVDHSRDAGRAAGSRTLIYAFFFFFLMGRGVMSYHSRSRSLLGLVLSVLKETHRRAEE